MNKYLKSCLRILLATLAIILPIGLILAGIYRDARMYDIDYDLILFIILFIVLFVFYIMLIYNTFRPQKWTKRMLIFTLSLVLMFLFYIIFSFIRPTDNNSGEIIQIISIILSIYGVLLIRAYKIQDMISKKRLKTIIRIILPFILLGTWAGLTRAGAIPNWFNIEFLCNDTSEYRELLGRDYTCDGYYSCCNSEGICVLNIHPELMLDKPIIYLYPIQETEVNVTLGTPENLSHTYPKYNPSKGRNVIANPNGDLEDMDTGRKLYALYREGVTYNEDNFDEGFVVKGEDTISFLEEKLAILGLNEREAEEFIVYWLPQMENNKYNLISFETKAEQDENMPLNITPIPDTVIRVMMDWKAIDKPINIQEQELTTPERIGFTVVEWGGSSRN